MNYTYSEVFQKFYSPMNSVLNDNPFARKCKELSDEEWLQLGIKRTLGDEISGRGFLQKLSCFREKILGVGLFFENLKSERRLNYIKHSLVELNKKIEKERLQHDVFASIKELNKYHIFGGDGHYHCAASHDKVKDKAKYGTQHFYLQNLRTQSMYHLSVAVLEEGQKKEHDAKLLQRIQAKQLKQNAKKGEKTLYVWDRAGVDVPLWKKLKESGVYFLSRSKKNMKFKVVSKLDIDRTDPVNNGILSYEIVETLSGILLNRVIYRDPFQQKTYSYITNLPNKFRPGVIAFLYKTRWDIEKVFDDFKNKMMEKKSWGSHDVTKTTQAIFLCITYNLALLLEDDLEEMGIVNDKDLAKKEKRIEHEISNSKLDRHKISSLLINTFRTVQIPVAFFRWLRSFIYIDTPWIKACSLLRGIYRGLT